MDVERFIEASMEGLRQQTAAHIAAWHIDKADKWNASLDTGELVFTFADGTTATTRFQIVGTFDSLNSTFLWGWDHPSVSAGLRQDAELARAWGLEHGVAEFTTAMVPCSETRAWEFAAVTARLANANGVYRGPAGTALVFMTFGDVRLQKGNRSSS